MWIHIDDQEGERLATILESHSAAELAARIRENLDDIEGDKRKSLLAKARSLCQNSSLQITIDSDAVVDASQSQDRVLAWIVVPAVQSEQSDAPDHEETESPIYLYSDIQRRLEWFRSRQPLG